MSQLEPVTISDDEDGVRLDRWIKLHYPGVPFGQLQQLLRSGQIRVDGARVKSSTRLATGQRMRVPPILLNRPDTPLAAALPPGSDATFFRSLILYEDRDLFVINKPPGLAVQGGSGINQHLDNILEGLRDRNGVKPRLVHRLDRQTSGCLMVARNRSTASALGETLRSRAVRKVYWALAYGAPRPARGRISTYVRRHSSVDGDMMVTAKHGDKDAQHAISDYAVLEQVAGRLSWMALSPVTGRTHQLRVHLKSIGHPIIGDPLYFDIENWQLPGGLQNKLHLHARMLRVIHPKTGAVITVKAPLPPHIHQAWRVLGLEPGAPPEGEDGLADKWWAE